MGGGGGDSRERNLKTKFDKFLFSIRRIIRLSLIAGEELAKLNGDWKITNGSRRKRKHEKIRG